MERLEAGRECVSGVLASAAFRCQYMPTSELERYFPVLVQALVAAIVAASLVALSGILGYRRKSPQKDTPYESGMPAVGDAQ